MTTPQVSIIIPSINREASLKKTLFCLERQIDVRFEIIVVHQSEFNTLNTTDFQNNISFIKSNIESASVARNIGILNSHSNILLFIDDDVLIEDNLFVYNHFKHYADKSIIGVVGRSYDINNKQPTYTRKARSFNESVGFLYYPKNYGSSTFFNSGRSNNLSVRKKYALAAGGMDENYTRGAHREETDFCLRVSNKFGAFLYDPNAKLVHLNESLGGIRSWDKNNFIKSKHHMIGAIYFNIKMAPFNYRLIYTYFTLRYLIFNKTILLRPMYYPKVITRLFSSYITALKLYKSDPKHIH